MIPCVRIHSNDFVFLNKAFPVGSTQRIASNETIKALITPNEGIAQSKELFATIIPNDVYYFPYNLQYPSSFFFFCSRELIAHTIEHLLRKPNSANMAYTAIYSIDIAAESRLNEKKHTYILRQRYREKEKTKMKIIHRNKEDCMSNEMK